MSILKVCEIFESIQGEGLRVGEPSVFIRLSGCNLRCKLCDTKYSWNEEHIFETEEIFSVVKKSSIRSLVITGGEPLVQRKNLYELLVKFKKNRFFITLETNGTIYDSEAKGIMEIVDLVAVSPKPYSFSGVVYNYNNVCKIIKELSNKVFLKIPIASEEDFEEIRDLLMEIAKPKKELVPVVFQCASRENENFEDYLKRNRLLWEKSIQFLKDIGKVINLASIRFIPQLHKLLFYEKSRGV